MRRPCAPAGEPLSSCRSVLAHGRYALGTGSWVLMSIEGKEWLQRLHGVHGKRLQSSLAFEVESEDSSALHEHAMHQGTDSP